MDPLADVLDLARVRGTLLANVRAQAPWGLDIPQSPSAALHAVTSGTAWLRAPGRAPVQLMPGDVALFPAGVRHQVSSELDGDCRPFDHELTARYMTPAGDLVLPGPGATTTFICAGYEYDLGVAGRLVGLLPDVLHVPADPVTGRDAATLVALLCSEVGTDAPGSRAASARLIDLLLITAVRAWAAGPGGDRPNWLTALGDPVAARALALLHDRPGHPWTLASLADKVQVSRATLARRFGKVVGEPPLTYLARWRVDLAARRLTTSTDSVEVIAREVGYNSAYAFNRAFARHRGQPPGRYRRAGAPAPQLQPTGHAGDRRETAPATE